MSQPKNRDTRGAAWVRGFMLGAILGLFCTLSVSVLMGANFGPKCKKVLSPDPNLTKVEVSEQATESAPYEWNICERMPEYMTDMQVKHYHKNKWAGLLGKEMSFEGTVKYLFSYPEDEHYSMFVENNKYDTSTAAIVVNFDKPSKELYQKLLSFKRGTPVKITGTIDGEDKCTVSYIEGASYSVKFTRFN